MSVKVQKYLANLGKSVVYSTADVLSEKFEYANEFKNENQEIFKQAYHSIKDYRTTFARIKKTLTNNKVMDAARVGYDSVLYSITTGDFYAKEKETEVINKYGGSLMQDMDIDDDDFDFESRDEVSEGDMVIATAVKKNSKISTAITTEAIAKTGKAQMDVSKENTMLLYTQNERLLNKLDGGLNNITEFLKQSGEQNAKIQNQMNENLNKFMSSVDNNINRLTKQMDELLEMQRNMYKPVTQEQKHRTGYNDIISSSGVINLREYGKMIGKQAFDVINDSVGGGLSMIFGDMTGEGSNMLAQFAANPFREAMKAGVNKVLGAKFNQAAKDLNTTLSNLIPDIMGKLNAAGNKDDNGIYGILGRIFGIKSGSSESINTSAYTKGPIPFDGITKKSIVEVIPFYLRKMTSAMTGADEAIFDFNTGRWSTLHAAKRAYDSVMNTAKDQTTSMLRGILEAGTGRSFESMWRDQNQVENMTRALEELAQKLNDVGDFGSIKSSEMSSQQEILYEAMREIFKFGEEHQYLEYKDSKGKTRKIRNEGPTIGGFNKALRSAKMSQNQAIKQLNENGGIGMLAAIEGLTGDPRYMSGKSYSDDKGDMNQRHIQEMPTAQILLKAKDEYGVTLYQYLRNMGGSLNYIKAYSTYLQTLPFLTAKGGDGTNNGGADIPKVEADKIQKESKIDYFTEPDATRVNQYSLKYYQDLRNKENEKARESRIRKVAEAQAKAAKKGQDLRFVDDTTDYTSDDGIGLSYLVRQYNGSGGTDSGEIGAEMINEAMKEEKKKEKEKWDKLGEIVGSDEVRKLKEASDNYDSDKGLRENLAKAKTTSEKLLIIGKWISQKTSFSIMDKATDTIIKTDKWLKNLVYGEDLKSEDQKKSLFTLLKDNITNTLKDIGNKITGKIDEWRQKLENNETFKKVKEKAGDIFGVVDSEGNIEKNGLFSYFTSGFRKGMAKNAEDVKKIYEEEKRKAKELANKLGTSSSSDSDSDDSSDSSSSSSSSSSTPSSQDRTSNPNDPRIAILRKQLSIQYEKYNKAAEKYKKKQERVNILKNALQDTEDALNSYDYGSIRNEDLSNYYALSSKKARQQDRYNKEKNELDKIGRDKDKAALAYNAIVTELKNDFGITDIRNLPVSSNTQTSNNSNPIILPFNMAVGGVNKTGRPFQSVLSAGEYLNGNRIGQTGIYTIPKGGSVYNPAPPTVRGKQAMNERAFIRNLKSNANADEGLTDEERAQHQQADAENRELLKQVDISKLTDWRSLSDKNEQAAFLGNLASRGAAGGLIGLLAGGPILGAAIGAASSLTQSTDGFSNFLFGDAVTKDGMVKYDADGKVVRTDNGLISKEIMNAMPDVKRLGLAGLIGGLLTPLGPVGGIIAGSALGFAKNSEIFQGSLFGEGGIISDDKIDKLKKGYKNMGIGAATAALLLPGPFGLIGSALIGATAGYITSTDKFKNAILGELEDPNNPESKRHGGVVGAVKNAVEPLKAFGKTIVSDLTDAIFGKKDGDGKREGGLFGIVKDTVISPLAVGTKSIVKELQNKVVDIGFWAQKTWNNIQKAYAGGNIARLLGEHGSNLIHGAIGVASGATKLALKPVSAVANAYKRIGDNLTANRIRRGRADDMTARERIAFRGSHGMAAGDDFTAFDNILTGMNNEDMQLLLDRLNFTVNADKAADKEYITLAKEMSSKFEDYLSQSEMDKLNTLIKAEKYGEAERMVKTYRFKGKDGLGVTDEQRNDMLSIINTYKRKRIDVNKRMNKAKNTGKLASDELKQLGLNIDLSDAQQVDNIERMLRREMAHNEAGLTDEDITFDREREFWTDEKSPLNPLNTGVKSIVETIDNIYSEIRLSNEYKELSPEEKAKYSSMEEYIDKRKEGTKANEIINDVQNVVENNKLNTPKPLTHYDDLINASNNDKVKERMKKIAERAANIFDNKVMQELSNQDRITGDKDLWESENPNEEDKSKMILVRRGMTIVRNIVTYTFDVKYKVSEKGITVIPEQPDSYFQERDRYITDYCKAFIPKDQDPGTYMSFIDMAKKSVKLAGFFTAASFIPGGAIALAGILGLKKLNKKFGFTKKAADKLGDVKRNIKYHLGEHNIDLDSKGISKRASKAYKEALKNNDPKLDEIAQEKYGKNFNELSNTEQSVVGSEFRHQWKLDNLHKLGGRGLKGDFKQIGRNIKSGVSNAIAGSINFVKAKKQKAQEKETAMGKFFDKLDAWRLKHDKQNFEGKKDSRLAKILKWIFIGGIAVPLIVGFLKQDVLPAIHEKIQPWLAKAKDKVFGVKNEQTGEYEGGIISGIVNPIRKFFKSKFEKVHNWIHNEEEFSDENKGLSGFWKSLTKVGAHIIELWKSGFTQVYGEFVPKLLVKVGKAIIPGLGHIMKGMFEYLGDVIKGKQSAMEIPGFNDGENINLASVTTDIPNTVGGTIQVSSPGYSGTVQFNEAGISANGNKLDGKTNTDGTKTVTNDSTGKSITSKNTGDYYFAGTNANGLAIYKDSKTNKAYISDGNGGFMPISDYQEVYDESLGSNEAFAHQKALENANALNADYTSDSSRARGFKTGANVLGRLGNTRILNSAGAKVIRNGEVIARVVPRGASTINGFGNIVRGFGGFIEHLPKGKIPGKLIKGIGRLGEGFITLTTAAQTKAYNALGAIGDKTTGGLFTRIGEKQAQKDAMLVTEQATKIAKKETKAALKAEQRAAKKAAKADKLARITAKLEEKGGLAGKIIETFKKIKGFISKQMKKILSNEKVAKVLGKGINKNADDITKGAEEVITKVVTENADDIATKGATTAAKGVAKAIPIISIVADFLLGVDNCRNILGIVSPKPSLLERLAGGIINMIPSVIMSIGEFVTVGTFGAAVAINVITMTLGIVGTVILSIDSVRDELISGIIDLLDKIPGIDMSKIKEEREQAKTALAAYNTKNNTNLSMEEYNNLIGNKTVASKIGDSAKNFGSAIFGYDSASKNVVLEKTENLDTKGKSDVVRKKLATIFSSIWQFYGEKDFNFSSQYDEDGNELSGKAKLNANKFKFNEVSSQIISNLNSILISESVDTIKDVASNVTDFTGPIDSKFHLKNVYKSGRDNPQGQFDIDEEHAEWKRIRAIAGVCAIINEIFEPCGKKAEITEAVVSIMMPAYFSSEESANISINQNDTSQYKLDASQYNEATTVADSTAYGNIDKYGNNIATNANANDRLSPMSSKSNIFDKISNLGTYFSDLINNSIDNLTGDFDTVEEFFKNLNSRNKSTNESIDSLSLLPTDKKYWKIETDSKNPFMSGLFRFVESMNRIIKAPFALAAASLAGGLNAVAGSSGSTGSSNTGASPSGTTASQDNTSSGTTSSSGGVLSNIWNGAKNVVSKVWGGIKSLFGKGKNGNNSETGYGDDPYHIYQREYSGSYRTTGDTEAQTIADSGCGPASAASVLRMYGKKGDMRNAVNYALQNKYKEVDGGTYPQYFTDYLNKNGIPTNSNANNADVVNSLAQGKPVVLMGRDTSNKGNTPYGSRYSHYVVARGIDSKGNVIVEDSEDKRGSTRYNLAETLNNSTVRITTGRGKYGRAKNNESVGSKYITGVTGLTTTAVSNIVATAASSVMGKPSGSSSSSSSGGVTASNVTGDAAKALGKELTMSDGKGNTHTIKITEDEVELYNMLTTECGLSPAAACGAIGNWEQECGINSIKSVATKGVIAYGGGIMQWTPGSKHTTWASAHGFSSDPWSWEANLAHAKEEITTGGNWSNPKKANPSFESEGLTPVSSFAEFKVLTDPESAAANFERVYEVSGDWNGKNSEGVAYKQNMIHDNLRRLNAKILYQLIVGGGSGRGKSLFKSMTKKFMDNTSKAIAFSAANKVRQLLNGGTTTTSNQQQQQQTNTTGSSNYQGTKYELTDSEIAQLAYVCEREQGGSEWGTKFEASLMCNLFEYHNRNKQRWSSVWDYVMNSGWFASRSTGSSSSNQQTIEWVKDVICNGNRACPQCIIEHDCMSDFSKIYNGERSNKAGFKANVTEFDNVYGGHWIFWSFPGGDTSMDPFGYTKDSLQWAGGQVPPAPSWENNSEDTSGSGRGNGARTTENIIDNTIGTHRIKEYTANSVSHSNRSRRHATIRPRHSINIAGKGGSFYGRGYWGRDGEDDKNIILDESTENFVGPIQPANLIKTTSSTTEEETTTPTTSSNANNTDATGLISLLGKYSKALSRGIFGDFYDALFGNESDGTNINTGNNDSNASYKGDDVVYAAAMVFEALYNADPTLRYDSSGKTTHTLTCRDGTVLENVRPDCSGMMTAVIQYMGYYTYKTKEYSDTYHGEGLSSSSMSISNIYDADGNPTSDWEIISPSEATGDKAKAGDIRTTSGHTDMFVFYGSGNYPRGFNAGSGDCGGSIGTGMYNSYCLAKYYFEHNNQLPDPSSVSGGRGQNGAGTITDASTNTVLRFKGKSASGRGKGKVNLSRLNAKIHKSNFIMTDKGRIYANSINASNSGKIGFTYKTGRGRWGRDGEEDTNTNSKITLTPENTAETTETTTTTATTTTDRPAKTIISKLSKYAKAAVKGVFGNFYDALYGSEVVEESEENNGEVGSGTAGTLQTAIPYSKYSIWKQGWPSSNCETWYNGGWNKKTAISISNQTIGEAGCSLSSTALMLAHSGVVQEADFDIGKFADDVNTRSNCAGICGGDAPMRHMCEYKGSNTMQYVDSYSWSYDGKSFDDLYNFVLESYQQGYFLIGHVTNHFCCIDYIDTAHKIIFIMDPGFSANCWYDGNNKPSVLDSTDRGYTMSSGPSGKHILGVIRYKSSTTSPATCYVLNGRRSFDSLHPNGNAPNATISNGTTTTSNTATTSDSSNIVEHATEDSASGRGKYGRAKSNSSGREGPEITFGTQGSYDGSLERYKFYSNNGRSGRGLLTSLDNVQSNISSSNYMNNLMSKSTSVSHGVAPISGHTSTSKSTYNGTFNGDGSVDITQLIQLLQIIANNSDKMDAIATLLGVIATNTENTTNAVTNNKKKVPESKNGLSALRTALNDNNNGADIINAIYQIAKS